MTRELQTLAGGRLVLVLEGGYDLAAICDSAETCVRVLVGEDLGLPVDKISSTPTEQVGGYGDDNGILIPRGRDIFHNC